jgi:hypothetical protein
MTEVALSGVETATGEAETATVEVLEAATAAQRKCTPQYVLTVVSRPRFHSSQLKGDRFTAGTAYQDTENSKFKILNKSADSNLLHHHFPIFLLVFSDLKSANRH